MYSGSSKLTKWLDAIPYVPPATSGTAWKHDPPATVPNLSDFWYDDPGDSETRIMSLGSGRFGPRFVNWTKVVMGPPEVVTFDCKKSEVVDTAAGFEEVKKFLEDDEDGMSSVIPSHGAEMPEDDLDRLQGIADNASDALQDPQPIHLASTGIQERHPEVRMNYRKYQQ